MALTTLVPQWPICLLQEFSLEDMQEYPFHFTAETNASVEKLQFYVIYVFKRDRGMFFSLFKTL
jgi:hypothetical protein